MGNVFKSPTSIQINAPIAETKEDVQSPIPSPIVVSEDDPQLPDSIIYGNSVPSESAMHLEPISLKDYHIRIDMEMPTPIPSPINNASPNDMLTPQSLQHIDEQSPQSNAYGNIMFKPTLDLNQTSVSHSNSSNEASAEDDANSGGVMPIHIRFTAKSDVSELYTRSRSDSKAKRYMSRARSISRSITDPRHSKAFIDAKHKLDTQQLKLINNMTRHGLLLIVSSLTSLSCLVYILCTFEHYDEMTADEIIIDDSSLIAYYYLYWNMGICSFLNALSLYLSFTFAQWFYIRACNKVHKWLEALCVIVIVKQLKLKQDDESTNKS